MTREEQISYLKNKVGKEITDRQAEQLHMYFEMLVEKNKVMNLTGITEFKEVVEKHFYDSMIPNLKPDASLIDVGTGAGFPGLPLKILYPDMKVTLMDSLNKRILFLEEVIHALGLKKIEVIHSRAEELGKNPKYREQFEYSVSRAVANLATLSEYCVPFVKKGGCFISYKSGKVQEELESAEKAIGILGGKVQKVEYFELPDSKAERSLVYIEKVASTPKKYPRKAGTPAKEPLQ